MFLTIYIFFEIYRFLVNKLLLINCNTYTILQNWRSPCGGCREQNEILKNSIKKINKLEVADKNFHNIFLLKYLLNERDAK